MSTSTTTKKGPETRKPGAGDGTGSGGKRLLITTAGSQEGTQSPSESLPSFTLPAPNKSALCNGRGLDDQSEKDCPACSLQLACSGHGDEVGSSSLGFMN